MRAIMESLFDIIYLLFVTGMGIYLITKSKDKDSKMFGIMAVVLGAGDAFHLIPRIFALNTASGFVVYQSALGIGKAITSITMTLFYILLYYIFIERYNIKNKTLDMGMWGLAIIRIVLGLLPQNQWTSSNPSFIWSIYRNIPFAIMGLILIIGFYKKTREFNDKNFKHMGLAITLSFGFYIPVVLWGDLNPLIGLLMIPKTLAYVWIVIMGYKYFKEKENKSKYITN